MSGGARAWVHFPRSFPDSQQHFLSLLTQILPRLRNSAFEMTKCEWSEGILWVNTEFQSWDKHWWPCTHCSGICYQGHTRVRRWASGLLVHKRALSPHEYLHITHTHKECNLSAVTNHACQLLFLQYSYFTILELQYSFIVPFAFSNYFIIFRWQKWHKCEAPFTWL